MRIHWKKPWRVEIIRCLVHFSDGFKSSYAANQGKFVNDGFVQSALREWKVFAASPRFWITFVAVVLLFAFTGPFGTSEKMAFGPRLGYWLVIHAAAWTIVIVCVVIANVGLRSFVPSMFARMVLGAALASLPAAGAIMLVGHSWHQEPLTLSVYFGEVAYTLPLNLILCLLTYLAMSAAGEQALLADVTVHALQQEREGDGFRNQRGEPSASAEAMAPPAAMPTIDAAANPLVARLKPENRGRLLHISVEDHYSRVTTSRGRELLLMRFSDAMREAGQVEGMQVHRSHWVARSFVRGLRREAGKLILQLEDDSLIPVSRTYAAAVRDAFAEIGRADA